MTALPRVVVLEDQPHVAAAVRDLLSGHVDVVAVCHTLALGGEVILRSRPDAVVTDFRLPDGDAVDVFGAWRAEVDGLSIVVMSAWTDERSVRRARDAGASAYLDKGAGLIDLPDVLRDVLSGADHWSRETVEPSAPAPEDVEGRVLAMVCDGASTSQMMDALGLTEAQVRHHVNALLRRQGVRRRADLTRTR